MNMIKFIMDTGTGPNLIEKFFSHPTWAPCVMCREFKKFRVAIKEPTRSEIVSLLTMQIGNLRLRVWFGVFKDLAINLLLCTESIDQYVHGSFPEDGKLLSWHSRHIETLLQLSKTIIAVSYTDH